MKIKLSLFMWILMASLPTGVAQAATLEVKEGE